MKKVNVAIDGPSGAGKSSIAKEIARQLQMTHLDTGSMYRAITYFLDSHGIEPVQSDLLSELIEPLDLQVADNRVLVNGEDVTDKIRTEKISNLTSRFSKLPAIREKLVDLQRKIASEKGFILDGRDICEVVLPDAEVKIYLDASDEERAMRRWKQLQQANAKDTYEEVLAKIRDRDYEDTHREFSPLIRSESATYIDSSDLTFEQTVNTLKEIIKSAIQGEVL